MAKVHDIKTIPFEIEVPYQVIESGRPGKKPLILYLHGFNQNINGFQEHVSELLTLEAYHLFIQGPYPIYDRRRRKNVEEWGRAWYLYDGNQDQFMRSMEKASVFIDRVLKKLQQELDISRLALFGYSMGGYLAGYFALSRPKQLKELMIIGGRLKTEIIERDEGHYRHLKVLALHGNKDHSVESSPQKRSCERLSKYGARVTFKQIEGTHKLTEKFIREAKNWLKTSGYSKG